MPQVGSIGQRKLLNAKVLMVGAGGLGSPISIYLTLAGIGRLGIVDFDTVDVTNLQRQILHYNEDVGRVEMYLGSTCAQTVRIEDLDLDVPFEKGEEIHTENSHKYSLDEIDTLANAARMQVERRWLDTRGLFSKNLLKIRNAR